MRISSTLSIWPIFCLFILGVNSKSGTYSRKLWTDDSNQNVSANCKKAIAKLDQYIIISNATSRTSELLDSFFGRGYKAELITDDRFLYRMMQCFKFAGDTKYVKSEHAFHYCYGYDVERLDSTAYSICLPSPCANDNLTLLEYWKATVTLGRDEIPITETKCVRSRSEKQWFEKLLPIFCLLYILFSLLIVSLATIYHYQRNGNVKSLSEKLFLAFSVRQNLPKILYPNSKGRSMINCMHGIRFFAILWIIVGHWFVWVEPYIENVDDFKMDIAGNFFNQWITNFLLTVDIFLVLGGTVNAYGWFCKIENMERKPGWFSFRYWLDFYRHRVVRLWPAHFYTLVGVIFLSSTHFHQFWPELDPVEQCSKYWWQNLLLISSFFGNKCMGWTWYISAEFMLYLVSPIFLVTLLKSKTCGILLCISTIILSSLLRGYAMVAYNLPPTQLGWINPKIFTANFMQQFAEMYMKPQYRIGPYIIGILLGYHLFNIRDSLPKKPSVFYYIGWLTSAITGLMSVVGLYPVLMRLEWPVYYVIYGSIHRVTFALSVAWTVYACHIGVGGYINHFLGSKIFYPFASLSYTVYLSHMPVLFGSYLQLSFPYYYTSKVPMLLQCLVSTVLSYILGLQCSLLSELPAINIEKVFLTRQQTKYQKSELKELSMLSSG